MEFLSQGDYNFPFTWPLYWAKHVYMWSYQSGTPNPDGFIRLPARALNFIVFILFGHMAVSYFYALSSLVIAGIAFYIFGKLFLKVNSRSILLLGTCFFALNPLFLGNLAKVGLVFSASMLPLCFVVVQRGFEKRQFRYFVMYLVFLNLSLMHPYTFIVNLAASGLYFCWLAWRNRAYVLRNLHKFALVGVLGILLNAYFILPVASLGTVSKDVISDNVVPAQTDYTSLVSFSNTGDILTGLSLAKNVFLDFNFYNDRYQPLYLMGTFGFYALLIVALLQTEKFLYARDKRRLALMFASFLMLVLLATTMVFGVNDIIKMLISLPGGWAFRSPLKWQLYMPLPLFGMLILLLYNMDKGPRLLAVELGLATCFLLMNGYLFYDIYKQLLIPRALTNFAALNTAGMDHKTLLYVNSPACMQFTQNNPRVVTELNQVFVSRDMQVKRVLIDDLSSVNVGSYDYVLSCQNNITAVLEHKYRFARQQDFVNHAFALYKNDNGKPEVYALKSLYGVSQSADIGDAYNFAGTVPQSEPFAFVYSGDKTPATSLTDVFGTISPDDIHHSSVSVRITPQQPGQYMLNFRQGSGIHYVSRQDAHSLFLSSEAAPGFQPLQARSPLLLDLPDTAPLTVTYTNPSYDYKNLVNNPSLENGLWHTQVGDCYAFDENPAIAMRLDTHQKTDGKQSLELSARRHIACTGPDVITVTPGKHYLFSFDYESSGTDGAGLHVMFDDQLATNTTRRMQENAAGWQHFSDELTVPAGARHLRIMLLAYPGANEQNVTTHFDNLKVIETPPLQDQIYIEHMDQDDTAMPDAIRSVNINPTKKLIHVSGASRPFYLASSESYHPLWQLVLSRSHASAPWSLSRGQLAGAQHIRLNNTMNAWYVDPRTLCAAGTCRQEANGSYDIDLTMQFASQHWFYAGAAISGVAWSGVIGYFTYTVGRSRRKTRRYQL